MGYITETVAGLGWIQEDEFLKNHIILPDSVTSISDIINPIERSDINITLGEIDGTVDMGGVIKQVLDEMGSKMSSTKHLNLSIKQTKKKSFIARLLGL